MLVYGYVPKLYKEDCYSKYREINQYLKNSINNESYDYKINGKKKEKNDAKNLTNIERRIYQLIILILIILIIFLYLYKHWQKIDFFLEIGSFFFSKLNFLQRLVDIPIIIIFIIIFKHSFFIYSKLSFL